MNTETTAERPNPNPSLWSIQDIAWTWGGPITEETRQRLNDLKAKLKPTFWYNTARGLAISNQGAIIDDDETHQNVMREAWKLREEKEARDSYALGLLVEFREQESDWILQCAARHMESLDYAKAGLMMGFRGYSYQEMQSIRGHSLLMAALMAVAIQRSPQDETPLFASIQEAEVWQEEPGLVPFIEQMESAIGYYNPDLMKGSKKQEAKNGSEGKTKENPFTLLPAWCAPPENPSTEIELILWAAYWSIPSAERLGVLRKCMRGDAKALDELALALPALVGAIERDHQREKDNTTEAVFELYKALQR